MTKSFSPYFKRSEKQALDALLWTLEWDSEKEHRIEKNATALIEAIRASKRPAGQLESFMQQYSINTDEGLALMTLAEALLRIADRTTAIKLIKDKLAAANWLKSQGNATDWVVKAAGVGLFMSKHTLDSLIARVGEPILHQIMVKAMQAMGKQFVIGETIEDALQNAQLHNKKGYNLSYDMLGEGARTAIDAEHYFDSYMRAIAYIGERASKKNTATNSPRPGISVKLSALHPRYEYAQEERCIPEISARLLELAKSAASYNINMTIDAEETPRLNSSIKIIANMLNLPSLNDWEGFGLALQAYHKAAPAVIEHISELARNTSSKIQMRLVKGAYWDSEIKHAQIAGLEEFPVYTRKSHSDISYMTCAQKMIEASDYIYPMFATHNAYSVAAIIEMSKNTQNNFEFQRLFGMGEALFDHILKSHPQIPVTIYAPVGSHQDLLPYLVRRLLENGANSSFVNRVLSPDAPTKELVESPVEKVRNRTETQHPNISKPNGLYLKESPKGRINSAGLDLHAPEVIAEITQAINNLPLNREAASLIGGKAYKESVPYHITNPALHSEEIGLAYPASIELVDKAYRRASDAFASWNERPSEKRAACLLETANLFEANRKELIALLVKEAGKTIEDAHDELREAVDFCRYYASQGQELFAHDTPPQPGPTGESNILTLEGRGTFVCISPWNFPLAIFTGQIAAALMAGNCVIAKPAEQTPLIAAYAIELMHKASIPKNVLQLIIGDGQIGAQLTMHQSLDGVAFTGSIDTARSINSSLAEKPGSIAPLIAETGGQNAMIVDSSALPEQVVDDVIRSAFGSAGQRCSALRVLYLQNECADKIIRMISGAVHELNLNHPSHINCDIGPVIDEEAHAILSHHRQALEGFGKLIAETPLKNELERSGHFFAPSVWELHNLHGLTKEVFGPILHIVRYDAEQLDDVIDELNTLGYGLTLGIHSRIETTQKKIAQRIRAGNIYINRSMTGAVVGTQPFGGRGLSGTGPKAGGPHYLPRFATEKLVCTNTAAAGGNASLVSLQE